MEVKEKNKTTKTVIITIFVTILAIIVVLFVFAYFYNKTHNKSVYDDCFEYNRIESIEVTNSRLNVYEGTQIGTSVKSLCAKIKSTSMAYEDLKERIPMVIFFDSDSKECISINYVSVNQNGEEEINKEYVRNINNISSKKVNKDNQYYVKCRYDEITGIVNKVMILTIPEDAKDLSQGQLKEYMKDYTSNIIKTYINK